MLSWFRALTPPALITVRRPRRRRYRPWLEGLESREVPASGGLDTSFGQNGLFPLALHGATLGNAGVAAAPGNEIVLAGVNASGNLVIARLTAAGRLDPSFGSGGETVLAANVTQVGGVVVTPAGLVITVARNNAGSFVVARLNRHGQPDTSFGPHGVRTVGATLNSVSGVALAPGNNIVVAGSTRNGTIDVARLTARGLLDPTFGNGGQTILSAPGGQLSAGGGHGVAVTSAGQVLVVGTDTSSTANGTTSGSSDFFVARLTRAGHLDPHFDSTGESIFGDGQDRGTSVAVQSDGKVVVGGTDAGNLAAARLTSAGLLDTSFGTRGIITLTGGISNASTGVDLTLLPNKNVLLSTTSNQEFALAELTSAGQPNPNFGNNGLVLLSDVASSASTANQGIPANSPNLPQTLIAGNGLSVPTTGTQPVFNLGLPQNIGFPATGVSLPGNVSLPNVGTTTSPNLLLPNVGTTTSPSFSLPTTGSAAQQAGTTSTSATPAGSGTLLPGGVTVLANGRIVVAGTLTTQSGTQVIAERLFA